MKLTPYRISAVLIFCFGAAAVSVCLALPPMMISAQDKLSGDKDDGAAAKPAVPRSFIPDVEYLDPSPPIAANAPPQIKSAPKLISTRLFQVRRNSDVQELDREGRTLAWLEVDPLCKDANEVKAGDTVQLSVADLEEFVIMNSDEAYQPKYAVISPRVPVEGVLASAHIDGELVGVRLGIAVTPSLAARLRSESARDGGSWKRITHVVRLKHCRAEDAAKVLQVAFPSGLCSADAAQNTVVLRWALRNSIGELAKVETALRKLDVPTSHAGIESSASRALPNTPAARQLVEQLQAQESAATAEAAIIRHLQSNNQAEQNQQSIAEHQRKLKSLLSTAFDLKLQLEDLQVKELQSRLVRLEREIGQRKELREKIVQRRAAELTQGDALNWWSSKARPNAGEDASGEFEGRPSLRTAPEYGPPRGSSVAPPPVSTNASHALADQILAGLIDEKDKGQLKGASIHFVVENSSVFLKGTVATADQKNRVVDIVRRVPGVTEVRSNLTITTQAETKSEIINEGSSRPHATIDGATWLLPASKDEAIVVDLYCGSKVLPELSKNPRYSQLLQSLNALQDVVVNFRETEVEDATIIVTAIVRDPSIRCRRETQKTNKESELKTAINAALKKAGIAVRWEEGSKETEKETAASKSKNPFAAEGAANETTAIRWSGAEGTVISIEDVKLALESKPANFPIRRDRQNVWCVKMTLENAQLLQKAVLAGRLDVCPSNLVTAKFLHASPVPLVISEEDLRAAWSGDGFIKVVYLPDPQLGNFVARSVETVVSTRLDPGVDAIHEADRRGTILLVLRLARTFDSIESPPSQN